MIAGAAETLFDYLCEVAAGEKGAWLDVLNLPGDLHEFGKLGKLVTTQEATALV